MTAEPIPEVEQRSVPDWLIPPTDGFTTDEFLKMDGLPPHTELIDGSLVFVGPQRDFHGLTMYLLESGLRGSVPEHLRRVPKSVIANASRASMPRPEFGTSGAWKRAMTGSPRSMSTSSTSQPERTGWSGSNTTI